MKLSDLLLRKGHVIVQVRSGTKVIDAVRMMVEHKVGAVLVVDDDHISGIFTERDHLRATAHGTPDPGDSIIDEFMIKNPVIASPADSIEDAMVTMTERRVRHLPVLQDGRLVGIVSIGDVVKEIANERAAENRHLRDYITGVTPESTPTP